MHDYEHFFLFVGYCILGLVAGTYYNSSHAGWAVISGSIVVHVLATALIRAIAKSRKKK